MDVLSALSEDGDGVCSPKEVLTALMMHRWRIDFQQQVCKDDRFISTLGFLHS